MIESGEENIDLHLDHFVHILLPLVRFPMMTPAQLADLLLNPLSQTHTELLVERIRIAMCYHKNQLEISERGQVGKIKIYILRSDFTGYIYCLKGTSTVH